jgi:hypothetical protein
MYEHIVEKLKTCLNQAQAAEAGQSSATEKTTQ